MKRLLCKLFGHKYKTRLSVCSRGCHWDGEKKYKNKPLTNEMLQGVINKMKDQREIANSTCPKCGYQDFTINGVVTHGLAFEFDSITTYHCLRCYMKWLISNVPEMINEKTTL